MVPLRSGLTVGLSAVVMVLGASCSEASDDPQPAEPTQENAAGYDTQLVERGRGLYEETCAACHGADLEGTRTGPPFLSPIYAPDHHPDEAFFAAAANGVQPHHWDFGPMPPQPGVTRADIEGIVAYIRTQQVAAGIIEESSE